MINQEHDQTLTPKRQLSRFLCREMLYDFVSNNLDHARRKAVDEFLPTDFETQQELENLREGLGYCSRLGETRISVPLLQEIRDYKSFWVRVKEGHLWRSWPDAVKWGIEALVISVVAAGVAMVIPWKRISHFLPKASNQFVLVEVNKEVKTKPGPGDTEADQTAIADGRSVPPVAPEVPDNTEAVPPPEGKKPTEKVAETKPTAEVKAPAKAPTENATPPAGAETSEVTGDESSAPAAGADRKPMKGYVYRAFMTVEGVDGKTGEITQGLQALGGTKAGQVELGWRKAKGSYFHFSLPESNYEEVVKLLRNFGPVRIYKDPHWRVMPEGKIRFILWVEETKSQP
ncbi:MAG: hypothetical protein IT288_03105 [Bdellovibrionales bacterium]|nr:hypothetical protein [Bdellovibrionales bacterium]